MTRIYTYDGAAVRALEAPGARPLRWAAWRPDGARALLAGNRGQVVELDASPTGALAFGLLDAGSAHNLRGVGWAPDGSRALLVGNRGAVLDYDGRSFTELVPITVENLRRIAWSPDGSCALIAGNAGCVLRFDAATGALQQLPGDRAHTMRSIAWRPDGVYALIGAYASHYAGYPRPHMLYRCDGRYTQAILTTDDEDDAIAIDWQPGPKEPRAAVLVASYGASDRVANKIVHYTGSAFRFEIIDQQPALLGAAWHPDGSHLLICGERGTLLRHDDGGDLEPVASGTSDNLVGPFWQPNTTSPLALMLKGPGERVYTI
ncbi:MAG: WD40 repeat domain-containing protein [Chloroflexota bacterium]|nr:WD40 repeat domain-containing protein [Chloroflexota bacterium]